MKKTYTKPEIEITAFTTEDIITVSNPMNQLESGTGVNVDLSDESKWEEPKG